MKLARKPHGAVLSFIVAAIFVVVLIGIAFATLLMLMGGNRQGTNANDAGNLNVAKCAPLIQVAGGAAGQDFLDISPTNQFNLTNINEVWGKTLLVNLNEQAMQELGASTGTSSANAALTWARAQNISSRLSTALNTRAKKEGFHQSVADRNRVNMLTLEKSVDVSGNWRTSCMNRGTESNLNFVSSQLPPGITEASLGTPTVEKTDSRTGQKRKFWMGYRGIKAAGRFINFVPFEFEGAPHHVSLKPFVANTLTRKPMPTWTSPVPNAFESVAFVEDAGLRQHTFDAAALAHVRPRTTPQITNGFVRFRLGQDSMKYYYHFPTQASPPIYVGNRAPLVKLTVNGYTDKKNDPTVPGSTFDITFNYGHQYEDPTTGGRTLYMALFGMGNSGYDEDVYDRLTTLLENRCNQIKPGTTREQIKQLLHSTPIPALGGTFILRLNGSNLVVESADNAVMADGKALPPIDCSMPNSANTLTSVIHTGPTIVHGGLPKRFHTDWTHRIDIVPGTGANGALLDVVADDDVVGHFYP